ncbi:MAG: shikimate dehydrogenase [Fibrobacteres bacterium]|nr:shikimate dehydrogenase [Fibrobacterota bacterium]
MNRLHLLGHPVTQSKSPTMQNAALRELGLDWEYSALDVEPSLLVSTLESLQADPIVVGCNITVPHKLAVYDWLGGDTGGRLEPGAVQAHAVNTLFRGADGLFRGDSTDALGGLMAVGAATSRFVAGQGSQLDLSGFDIAILGNGGSASSFAYLLAWSPMGSRSLTVFGRSPIKAASLASDVRGWIPGMESIPVNSMALDEFPDWNNGRKSLVIQTTTVGMEGGEAPGGTPVASGSVGRGQIAFDLVYKPHETPFLQASREHGADIVHGIGMLVGQGALSLKRWTNAQTRDFQLEAVMRTMGEALGIPVP